MPALNTTPYFGNPFEGAQNAYGGAAQSAWDPSKGLDPQLLERIIGAYSDVNWRSRQVDEYHNGGLEYFDPESGYTFLQNGGVIGEGLPGSGTYGNQGFRGYKSIAGQGLDNEALNGTPYYQYGADGSYQGSANFQDLIERGEYADIIGALSVAIGGPLIGGALAGAAAGAGGAAGAAGSAGTTAGSTAGTLGSSASLTGGFGGMPMSGMGYGLTTTLPELGLGAASYGSAVGLGAGQAALSAAAAGALTAPLIEGVPPPANPGLAPPPGAPPVNPGSGSESLIPGVPNKVLEAGASALLPTLAGGSGGSDGGLSQMQSEETARQARVNEAIKAINRQFGYGDAGDAVAAANKTARDSMYGDISGAVRDTAMRDADRQFSKASQRNTFGLARSGLTGGSVDAESGGELNTLYGEGKLKATQAGQQAGSDLRTTDERSRQNLISMAQSGLDTGTASSLAIGQMGAAADSAKGAATGATVGRLFDDMSQAYVTNQVLKSRYPNGLPQQSTGYGTNVFGTKRYSGTVQG